MHPRAFAAGVTLLDGRLWILGGLGINSILRNTEILEEKLDGTWKVTQGPNLPKPLFGQCVVALPEGNILVSGGFDGKDQSDIAREFEWDDDGKGQWKKEPWTSMKMKRYDHSCILHNGNVHAVGGWKSELHPSLKIERYNSALMNWKIAPTTRNNGLPDIIRSFSIGFSEGRFALLGGVSCITGNNVSNGRKCSKHPEVYEFEPHMGWKKLNNTIQIPRSSHVGVTIPVTVESTCN